MFNDANKKGGRPMQSRTTLCQRLSRRACLAVLLTLGACSNGRGVDLAAPGSSPETPSSPSVPPLPSISVIPPASTPTRKLPDGVLASIPLDRGAAPEGIAIGYGSVWVVSHRGYYLYRINPANDNVIAKIYVTENACGVPVVGSGRVWVQSCGDGTGIVVIDPSTDQVVGTLTGTGPVSMCLAAGSVWTQSRSADELVRLSASTLKSQATIDDGPISHVATLDGLVWTTHQDPNGNDLWRGTLNAIDPSTNRIVKRFVVPNPGVNSWLTAAFGGLWLKPMNNDKLLRVDPDNGGVTTYRLSPFAPSEGWGDLPVAVGMGSLWVRTGEGRISRVDPRDGKMLQRYPADYYGAGGDVAVGFGSLWVTNFTTDTVWRVQIRP